MSLAPILTHRIMTNNKWFFGATESWGVGDT